MAKEDQDSRTEDPTGKRQNEAREQGNVALSREANFAMMLLTTLAVILVVAPWSLQPLFRTMREIVEHTDAISLATPNDISSFAFRIWLIMGLALAPPVLLFTAMGVATTIAQTGGLLWATGRLKLNWNALNPMNGFSRLFQAKSLIEWAKGLGKLVLVGIATWIVMSPLYHHVENLIGMDPAAIVPSLSDGLRKLLLTVIGMMIVIAGADVAYQRWSHWRDLKMTKQEVKDEVKNADGDPAIKGKQRARRQARARQRMLKSVAKASVVVTNPTHYAVALQYERGMNAPKLLAKGVDFMAARIRELATEHDVPIIENPPVARAIYAAVEIDEEIPPQHYKAVAEIISYVLRLKQRTA
jgi:flagellar biosynthetic protein FlhB